MRLQKGFSLAEFLVVVAIMGIVATFTVPSIADLRDRNAIRGAADAIRSDLQLAQFEAIKRNAVVRFTVDTAAGCWGIETGSSCGCSVSVGGPTNVCNIKRSASGEVVGATITGARFGSATWTAFDPVRGTVAAGSVELTSRLGRRVEIHINPIGLTKVCTPDGAAATSPLRSC